MNPASRKIKVEEDKLRKRLRRLVGQAIQDFDMIEAGDRLMVCLSGGKDSYTLLEILRCLRRHAPVAFDLFAVHLNQVQPGYPEHVVPQYLEDLGIPYLAVQEDTHSIVKRIIPEGKTTCGLCSRLRRGILYRVATEHGVTKIALGHHRDDIIETLFLNMFHGGRLKAMPPKLVSNDGRHVVIRPLAYCREADIRRFAENCRFPIIPCNLCGSQDNLQRQAMKAMLEEWDRRFPGRLESIFASIRNVTPSHLADPNLYDFSTPGEDTTRDNEPSPSWLPEGRSRRADSGFPVTDLQEAD